MITREALELIAKHGVSAVLFIWLSTMQIELKDVKSKLYDCYGDRIEDYRLKTNSEPNKLPKLVAVRPKAPVKKKYEQDTEVSKLS